MKYLFYISIFFISTNSFGQSLTQQEFDKVYNEIKRELFYLKSNKDFPALFEKLNLSKDDIDEAVKLTQGKSLEFNIGVIIKREHQNHLIPFFQKSDVESKFLLTIYALTTLPEKAGQDLSDLGYADYYFVIECFVGLDNYKNLFFENTIIKTDEKDIENWYLFHHKNYLKVTDVVSKKYNYLPPPPPPLPNSMDNSPYHLDITATNHIINQRLSEAELLYDRLIEYYPDDAILYYRRGYAKYLASKYTEAIYDFSKSIELHKDNVDSYRYRGLAFYDNKEYQKALSDINKAINLNSSNPMLFSARAYIYNKLNLIKNACEDINESIRLGIFETIPESKNDIREFQNFCNEQE